MTNSSAPNDAIPRSAWLAVAVGSLTALGLKTVLPVVVLFLTRGIALGTDSPGLWLEHADDASHPVWLALQAAIALGAGLGGALAAQLAPRRSWAVPVALVGLSLLFTAFEQFPRPMNPMVATVWAGGPCLGVLAGWWLNHRRGGDRGRG